MGMRRFTPLNKCIANERKKDNRRRKKGTLPGGAQASQSEEYEQRMDEC
jgi:hypothetical protein